MPAKRPTVYRYRRPRSQPKPRVLNRIPEQPAAEEHLTGMVNGWEASAPEERFALALKANSSILGFTFREHRFGAIRNAPGAVEIDFIVQSVIGVTPVQIDGQYAHKTAEQRTADTLKDARLNLLFRDQGYRPVTRIPATRLEDQDSAVQVVDEVLA